MKSIEKQLRRCWRGDQHRLRKSWQSINARAAQGHDVAAAREQWLAQVQTSSDRVQTRRLSIPALAYPPSLPVAQQRDTIVSAIREYQVVIVAGETGSGKTTQLPKMCLEAGLGLSGLIGHTQPRRLAARSIANRIAEELKTEPGAAVGYKVRFQDTVQPSAYIKLMTDGILLSEIQHDRFLSQYDAIIIDEAHERSLNIDFLLGYLKQLLRKRRDLKLIVTSATIDHQRFADHFAGAPVIEVTGRSFPVQAVYSPLPDDDREMGDDHLYTLALQHAVDEALQLERAHPDPQRPGDILVFLPGEREIRTASAFLRKQNPHAFDILPLYSRLSNSEQNRVFHPGQRRRLVLATNVAETSLTVPNIGFVIDTGLARVSRYSVRSKLQRLPIEPVSQASADQRLGRCGRLGPGIAIRLFSEADYLERPAFTEPEIQRTNLAAVILQMMALRLGRVEQFPFIDPPDARLVKDGYRVLSELGALDDKQGLTPIGREMARLPIDPKLARMLIAARSAGCEADLLTIVSALSVPEPWLRPHEQQQAADRAHQVFRDQDSDFLTLVNLWHASETQREALSGRQWQRWLSEQFLSVLRMREWRDVHHQLKVLLAEGRDKRQAIQASSQRDYAAIHRAILAGLPSQVGLREDSGQYLGTRNRRFHLFPGSTLFSRKAKWVVAADIVETQRVYARTAARVEPEWIEASAAHLIKYQYQEPHWEKKQASAMAWRQSLLFGLLIGSRKKVSYAKVDPALSRQLFIQNALVAGDYATQAAYHQHNKALIADLAYLEQKTRRRDILLDDASIYAVFDRLIPHSVVNGHTFEQWRKKAERQAPRCLYLTEADLTASASLEDARHAFPDQLPVARNQLKLDYCFEPGKQHDGVALEVPLAVLNQVDEARLEWLVPGLELEKCIALIKVLPKSLRRQLVPAPDVAQAFLATQPDRQASLHEQFARFLRRRSQQDIRPELWDNVELPLHLQTMIKVLDEQGAIVCEGRDLKQLQNQAGADVRDAITRLAGREGAARPAREWVFDSLAEQRQIVRNGATLVCYPALVLHQDGVVEELFDTPEQARAAMSTALLALFRWALPQACSYLRKHCMLSNADAIKYSLFGDRQQLADGLEYQALQKTFLSGQPLVWSRQAFEHRLASQRDQLVQNANTIRTLIATILDDHQVILRETVKAGNPLRLKTYQDVREQLAGLFPDAWVTSLSYEQLQHYPHYFKAIKVRLERLQGNIDRDHQGIALVEEHWQRYLAASRRERLSAEQAEALEAYRWMIEEFRVSWFAPGVKTRFSISASRLEKWWHRHFG